jgi:hypothetical protein
LRTAERRVREGGIAATQLSMESQALEQRIGSADQAEIDPYALRRSGDEVILVASHTDDISFRDRLQLARDKVVGAYHGGVSPLSLSPAHRQGWKSRTSNSKSTTGL